MVEKKGLKELQHKSQSYRLQPQLQAIWVDILSSFHSKPVSQSESMTNWQTYCILGSDVTSGSDLFLLLAAKNIARYCEKKRRLKTEAESVIVAIAVAFAIWCKFKFFLLLTSSIQISQSLRQPFEVSPFSDTCNLQPGNQRQVAYFAWHVSVAQAVRSERGVDLVSEPTRRVADRHISAFLLDDTQSSKTPFQFGSRFTKPIQDCIACWGQVEGHWILGESFFWAGRFEVLCCRAQLA